MKTGLAIVGFVVVALVVGTCVACIDDDDEAYGWAEVAEYDYERDGDDESGNGSGECTGAEAPCSDDDASPRFDDSPVEDSFNIQICVQPGSCSEDNNKEASL